MASKTNMSDDSPFMQGLKEAKDRKSDYMMELEKKWAEEEKERDRNLERRLERLKELKNTDVWKYDIEPKLVETLIHLETQFCSTEDINRRFALVEAYNAIKVLKIWFDEPI